MSVDKARVIGAWGFAVVCACLMVLGGIGGCVLDRNGLIEQTCSQPLDCDDGTECTTDTCNADGLCEHVAFDGGGSLVQVPFDCKSLRCDKGRAVEVNDDADLPTNPCTNSSCSEGVLTESPKNDGTECDLGSGHGTCQGGMCDVECDPVMDPEDPTWPCHDTDPTDPTIPDCTQDSCDQTTRRCIHDPLDNVPADKGNIDKDCKVILCVVGVPQTVNDNNDLPTDGNECSRDECNNGVPSNPAVTINTPCGVNGFCNGNDAAPACVGCNGDTDCNDDDFNDCIIPLCVNPGQPLATCGTQNQQNGVGCNNGTFCDGTETCSTGVCTNSSGNPCSGPDGDGNCSESCDENNDNCNAADPNGSGCNDNQFCTASDTCQGGGCQGSGNPCPGPDGDGDCSESCDEGNNNCNAADPNGSGCDDGLFCSTSSTCQGGNCAGSGNPCTGPDGDNNCSESCDEGNNNCNGPDPNGSACNDGAFCNGADTCSSGSCSGHAGDPCPGPDGDSNCSETCNEGADNCSSPDPNGSACNDGTFCNGTDTCNSGSCSSHTGNPCPGPDGDSNCAESCNEATDACNGYDGDGAACDCCSGPDTCDDMSTGCGVGQTCPAAVCLD